MFCKNFKFKRKSEFYLKNITSNAIYKFNAYLLAKSTEKSCGYGHTVSNWTNLFDNNKALFYVWTKLGLLNYWPNDAGLLICKL